MPIDFRSDVMSLPTEAMIEAMVAAARSSPGMGLKADPIVCRLEELAADELGKEDALFCPTCTLCNQIAVNIYCRPGEAFVAEAMSHASIAETGAVAALSGAMAVPVTGTRGILEPTDVEHAVRGGDEQRSRTALIVTENTHVYSGGRVMPVTTMQGIRDVARRNGLPVHLDGARLFNAAAFLSVSGQEIASYADSVSLSLNKGLAAPLGAILAGDRDFIREAVRLRQMFGGGWRPASIPAAAGIVALETMIDRMADDQRTAKRLVEGLASCVGVDVDADGVETNIVLAHVDCTRILARDLIGKLEEADILVSELAFGSRNTLRWVTHHGVGNAEVDRAVDAVADIMGPTHPDNSTNAAAARHAGHHRRLAHRS
ncbi:MAG: GntG family PLP-dependent aldolase [Rhodospirillales bacterium]|nr:GntG family PLP-dependent aldolase [Rhodospirillales bacterium]